MLKEYQKRITSFLSETAGPVDVEKIRKNCRIANWNTALKHCLELLIQGKIKGEETSKGWVFWLHQPTHLQPWEEAIGNFSDLKIDENSITVVLTTQKTLHITFPTNTPEAQILAENLKNIPRGTRVAILKTDIEGKPIIVKRYGESEWDSSNKTSPKTKEKNLERNHSSLKDFLSETVVSLKGILVLTRCFIR